LGLVYYEDLRNWKMAKKIFEKYLATGRPFKRGDMARTYLERAREKLSK